MILFIDICGLIFLNFGIWFNHREWEDQNHQALSEPKFMRPCLGVGKLQVPSGNRSQFAMDIGN